MNAPASNWRGNRRHNVIRGPWPEPAERAPRRDLKRSSWWLVGAAVFLIVVVRITGVA